MVQRRSKYFFFLLLPLVLLIQAAVAVPSKLIRVGVYHNPPLSFLDEDEVPQGFVVDILREVAKEEKWDLEFVFCEWKDCLLALESGDIDLLGPIAYSEERVKRFDFSEETLITNWGQVYVQSDEMDVSILDLDKKTLVVVEDDIHTKKLREQLLSFNFTVDFLFVDDYDAVMLVIEEGKAFGGVVNHLYALEHAADYDVVQSAIIYNPIEVRLAARKGTHADLLLDFDTQIAAMKRDNNSIYYQRLNVWFNNSPKYGMPLLTKWAVGILLISMVALALRSKSLRTIVRKRTETLEETETKYRELVNNSLVGIYILQDQIIQFCNQGLASLYGYETAEEMIGISIEHLATPESWSKVKQEVALRETGKKKSSHYRVKGIRRDGEIFDVEILGVAIQYNGKPAVQGVLLDITDRVRAEERFKGLAEASFEAVFISEEGVCVEANLAAENLFRYSIDEFIGMSGSDFFVLEDRNKVITNSLAGYKEPYPATALRKDGTTFPAEMRGRMMHYRGRAVRVSSIRDISEQVKAEQALQESEEKYRVFFKNNDAIILFVNPESGSIIFANDAASRFYGYAEEDLLEMNVMDINDLSPTEIKEKMKDAATKNQSYFLFTHMLATGELRDVEVYQTKLLLNDQEIFSIIVHDITERVQAEEELRESEEKLASTVTSLDDLLFVIDQEGIFTDYYQPPEKVNLYVSSEMFIGKHYSDVLPPSVVEKMSLAIESIRLDKKPHQFDYSLEVDSVLLSFNAKISMRKDSDGHFAGITAVIRNITERVQADHALRQSNKLLEQERKMFVGGAVVTFKWQNKEGWPVEYVSPNVSTVLGYKAEQFLSQEISYTEIISLEDIERVSREVIEGSNNGTAKILHEPYRITRRDGEAIWVFDHTTILYDDKRKITHYLGYVIDITERVEAQKSLQIHTQQLEMMNTISTALSTSLQLENLLEIILEEVARVIKFDAASIFFVNEDNQNKVSIVKTVGEAEGVRGENFSLKKTFLHNIDTEPIILDDARSTVSFIKWNNNDTTIRGWMGFPLIARGSLLGYLTFDSFQPRSFSAKDASLAESFSPQISQALYNARLHDRVIQDTNEMEKRVQARTEELQNFVELTAGREIRMAELKGVISKLHTQLIEAGQVPIADDPLKSDY